MIGSPLLLTGGDYEISRSVRLRNSASGYFSRTPGSAGNQKTFTFSFWAKRGGLTTATANDQVFFGVNYTGTNIFTIAIPQGASENLRILNYTAGSLNLNLTTSQVFRDVSAWYHFVVAIDTTQATSSDRAKLYVNGQQVTAFSTATYPAQNADLRWNVSSQAHAIGRESTGSYFDGYLTEINFIDGQALTPSSFGETDAITGVWKPKKYTGTYGTNGFYLNFSDNSNNTATTIGTDYSGNGNNWTPNNISVTSGATYDSMLDVPTAWADGGNGRGNYAVLNPLNINRPTIVDGNLRVTGGDLIALATIGMTSGAWYAEMTVTTVGTESSCGIAQAPTPGTSTSYVGSTSTSWGYYAGNGNKYTNASATAYGASYTSGDVIGIAFDADAGTLTFYKNNVSQGTAFTGLTSGPYYFSVSGRSTGTANNVSINFGQRPFAYTPPSGFKALNTLNLPEPTIKKGNLYFDATTYTGTGVARSVVNAAGMQPDLVWVKGRSVAYSHLLTDSVRGATKRLISDTTAAEVTDTDTLTAFNSNGFSWGTGIGGNQNAATYVAWQWKEGATQGFDIVTYSGNGTSGRTVSHSLGVAPSMMIVKSRTQARGWNVYHASLGNTQYIQLSSTAAAVTNSAWWNNTSPSSSVFTLGNDPDVNGSGQDYVAYLFSEVAGFSRFGSYTGNGSADGVFVFCGFRPAYVMIKRTDTTNDWAIHDKARIGYNVANYHLLANSSGAEFTDIPIDLLSNGFKLRGTSGTENASGGTYIFAAFAENPFKYSLAR